MDQSFTVKRVRSKGGGKHKRKRQRRPNKQENGIQIASTTALDEQLSVPAVSLSKSERLAKNRVWKHFDRFEHYQDSNPVFAAYYKQQLENDLGTAEEWETFSTSLSQGLPVTFRFCWQRNPTVASVLQSLLQNGRFQREPYHAEVDGSTIEKLITPLPYFGNNFGAHLWQLNVDAKELAKSKKLRQLHQFISTQVSLGNAVRQACASMVPAIVLGVEPGHHVVDMCSAPGSKTDQLIQYVSCSSKATGMVIANDSDPKRLQTLQRRFAGCPSPNLVVCCATAQDLAESLPPHSIDRIVCDVPCTGDGTVRKYPYLLQRWRPQRAIDLHPLQLDIAKAAATLLRVGGRMVYSTCSLNPIEDEAVVSALLSNANGALRLVEAQAPGFQCRAGLTGWRSSQAFLGSTNADDRTQTTAAENPLPDTIHAPSSHSEASELAKCMRILPHDQNTGGFFYALIEKVAEYEVKTGVNRKVHLETLREMGYNPKVKAEEEMEMDSEGENPLPNMHNTDTDISALLDILEPRDNSFPYEFMSRTSDSEMDLVFAVSKSAAGASKSLFEASTRQNNQLQCIQVGAPVATIHQFSTKKRVVSLDPDGVACLVPWISQKRKVALSREDFLQFLNCCDDDSDQWEFLLSKALPVVSQPDTSIRQTLTSIQVGDDFVIVCVPNTQSEQREEKELSVYKPKLSKAERKRLKKRKLGQNNTRTKNLESLTAQTKTNSVGGVQAIGSTHQQSTVAVYPDIFVVVNKVADEFIRLKSQHQRIESFKGVLKNMTEKVMK